VLHNQVKLSDKSPDSLLCYLEPNQLHHAIQKEKGTLVIEHAFLFDLVALASLLASDERSRTHCQNAKGSRFRSRSEP
jgi:hypothetical protein